MQIIFNYQKKAAFKDKLKLKSFLLKLIKKEKHKLDSLNIVFCSDEYLLKINNEFLSHNYFTDVITFDFSVESTISGEIYISVDRIKENAISYKTTFQQELHRVIFHGILHLCGYKDKTTSQKTEIRAKEDYYLSQYFK
jgi:rRNA maturation RNase YbeY